MKIYKKDGWLLETPQRTLAALSMLLLGIFLFAVNLALINGPRTPEPDLIPAVTDFPESWQKRLHRGDLQIFTVKAETLSRILKEKYSLLESNPERHILVSFGAPLQEAHLRIDRPRQGKADGRIYLYTAPGRALFFLDAPEELELP